MSEFDRVTATAEHRANIDRNIAMHYPLVSDETSLTRFAERKIPFATLELVNTQFLSRALDIALKRAADNSDPAFCDHADEGHSTFQETIDTLRDELESGQVSFRLQPHVIKYATNEGEKEMSVTRLLLEGEKRVRPTFRPPAQQFAFQIQQEIPSHLSAEEKPKRQAKILQKAASIYGAPFAIITAIYSGLSEEQIRNVFSNADIRRNIITAREQQGVRKAKLPPPNPDDRFTRLYDTIKSNILVQTRFGERPTYSKDSYFSAIEALVDSGYVADFTNQLRNFIEVDNIAYPIAVFRGMTEIAQQYASKAFLDPARSEYINDKFGKMASTQLITAYLEEEIAKQRNDFPEVFSKTPTGPLSPTN